ncbi:MAG: ECF transporter S component [Clostridia bacterium]|nr:ECF transporter S component [Clostridia bacterium]
MKKSVSIKKIASLGMFCALSFVMVILGKVIPNVAGFLSYDPKDSVIAISGFLFGPLYTVVVSLAVSLLEMVTISETGIIGCLMNFISTVAFAFPAALIYKKKRSYEGAVIGLFTGVVLMTACMILWNWLITPFYMLVERSVVEKMLLPVFLPFNGIKGGLNAALTLLLYKPLVMALRRAKLVSAPAFQSGGEKKPFRPFLLLVGLVLLLVFVALFLVFAGIL